jgi:SAM-dependent methyltransferase
VERLRRLIGERLSEAGFLDVGDTDGLMLKHLGRPGLGFNLAPAAVRNIEANGIEARLGDGQELPFEDGSFDYVLCFETLEHVESPPRLLEELARVCRADGRVFVSIPWVPRTYVHPRDFAIDRGYGHVFELCRDDFASLLTHTPLEIRSEDVCELLGPARTLAERAFLAAVRRSHIVGGGFRRFQFFELAHRP